MGRRGSIKLQLKRKRRDLTMEKKERLLCDFCGFSSRYEHEQGHQPGSSLHIELKRLQLLTRRLTCLDLDGLSFAELLLLETHLDQVLLIVKDRKKKREVQEDEILRAQKIEDDGIGMRSQVLVPCNFPSSSSSGVKQEQQDEGVVLSKTRIEYERQSAESMEMEFERLWLLKERLNARELEGMTSAQLDLLANQIYQAKRELNVHKFSPRKEQIHKKRREG